QGACAFAGCRPRSPTARAAMVAKINRVIVASMLDVDKNIERPVTIRRRNGAARPQLGVPVPSTKRT
ncbi:MAG: hypothetical protein WA478_23505, partial [Pseudolabrys sp.]